MRAPARVGCVLGVAFAAFVVAFVIGAVAGAGSDHAASTQYAPLPHRVPSREGGLTFRFAMAHDVLHERYPRSGAGYHRERIRITLAERAKYDPDAPISFSLTDDLAAAHARLGEHDEAVVLMRAKLARQRKLGQEGPSLYTTLSNLGTSLTYGAFTKAAQGDAEARANFREGVEALRAALKSNPMAHFGREKWQVAVAEHLLAAMEKPERLGEFDCLGNRRGAEYKEFVGPFARVRSSHGRAYDVDFGSGDALSRYPWLSEPGLDPEDRLRWEEFSPLRKHVTTVGAEKGWGVPSLTQSVPFDEPMLGLVGLWRQGGGPEAHFALAIGETMLRVGQRRIAWSAYERASRMADSFWPDAKIRAALIEHCRKRQGEIEASFRERNEDEDVSAWRGRFEAELTHGEAYQRAYQAYEAEKIAAGVPITGSTFHDEFLKGRDPIASPSGTEEWYAHIPEEAQVKHIAGHGLSWGLLAAGVAALLTALLFRWWPRPAPPVIDTPLPPATSAGPETDGRIQRGEP